ncbi:ATP-dependent DNA helicase Q4-like isoform X3 [Ostrea edulis]|uniref:ATP-dependent DNA helicase Q4-like isoform X3 n=1 Tax=Ostrea edulis TaxID=37623 RepID=UPI0024AF98BD|nr:ATP-dependent DNA helicase Q4-like isoform X3 [Ostrea edulis]
MEDMEEMKKLKVSLKKWETQFYKDNGRKPQKEEINRAPKEIQEAYHQYSKMKRHFNDSQSPGMSKASEESKGAVSESHQSTQGGVWGTDFNKRNQQILENDTPKKSCDETKTDASNMMHKLSSKLFEMAKKNNITKRTLPKFKSSESRSIDDSTMDSMKVNGKMFSNVKIKNKACMSKTSLNDQDVDVTEKYDVKAKQKFSISFSASGGNNERSEKTSNHCEEGLDEVDGLSCSVFDSVNMKDLVRESKEKENQAKDTVYQSPRVPAMEKDEEHPQNFSLDESGLYIDVRWDNETTHVMSRNSDSDSSYSKKRTVKRSGSKGENVEDDHDHKAGQDEPKVFDISDNEAVSVIPKHSRKRRKSDANNLNTNLKSKRRKGGGGETPHTSDGECDGGDADTKPKAVVPKRKPPPSVGNFVKLNMKVKTYKRKGKGMTGPQYKRFQWKQKMKARSESYGNNCFKCGKSGHWANKCPSENKESYGGEADIPPVSEEDFPSLKEAAMMARGVKPDKTKKYKEDCQTRKLGAGETAEPKSDLDGINWNEDMENEMDEDLEIQCSIVRTAREDTGVPPPHTPVLSAEEYNCRDTPDFMIKGLKKFGFEAFRSGQKHAVKRILAGLSTLVVLSTGGGKSLCYQLPAYLYAQKSKSVALVISPLVSLMEDQVTGLPPGVKGACLHTNMTTAQRESVLQNVKDGKVHFLLVSPEAVAGGGMTLFNNRSSLPPIAFVCIDEAHCLSEWSHNFRPSYLRLTKVLREKFGVQCFLGLTATATQSTSQDVAKHLGILDIDNAIIRGSPVPNNLLLSVSRDDNKDDALIGLLQGERFSSCESIIVYCTRRQETDRLATLIRTCLKDYKAEDWDQKPRKGKGKTYAFWDAENYHAGLTPAQRKRVQNAFMSGRLRVVVATVAFGMGLDKSDVHGIIHYNMPKSIEGYVQEIGRAGRDGKTSHCHLFLDSEGQDLAELKRHIYANTVDYRTLKKFVQHVFTPCHCKQVHLMHEENTKKNPPEIEKRPDQDRICHGHERAVIIDALVMEMDVKEEGILTLLCYLELHHLRWIQNLVNVYATCKVQCYSGPAQLQAVSKKCPPVAVAIAKAKKDGKAFSSSNQIEFPVVDISDCMGWDSGLVKRELKALSWSITSQGPRRTGVMVEFSNLAFHFTAPGDLSDEEFDDVLQFLHGQVQKHEKSEIHQLKYLSDSLKSVSHKNFWMAADTLDKEKNRKLKEIINDYFESQKILNEYNQREEDESEKQPSPQEISQAIADIRQLISIHGHEHRFSGRAIARIFHGISSPCFPAQTWGRARRFWRSNMNLDFNFLVKLAVQEIIRFK